MDLKFEWDSKKNIENIKKHGVSFEEAKMVFFDPKKREYFDYEHSLFEARWITIGLSSLDILKVVFTEIGDHIRIITARKAGKNDEEDYFNGYSQSNGI